jgi:hypothetical protein
LREGLLHRQLESQRLVAPKIQATANSNAVATLIQTRLAVVRSCGVWHAAMT